MWDSAPECRSLPPRRVGPWCALLAVLVSGCSLVVDPSVPKPTSSTGGVGAGAGAGGNSRSGATSFGGAAATSGGATSFAGTGAATGGAATATTSTPSIGGTATATTSTPSSGGAATSTGTTKALLGFNGYGVSDGSLERWLGVRIDAAGAWNDTTDGQRSQGTISDEYASWDRLLDNSVGAIDQAAGETWEQAAKGAYAERWTEGLRNLASAWGSRPRSLLHVRFAPEFNSLFKKPLQWKVTKEDLGNFVSAWKRFRTIFNEELPGASLVWCPREETDPLLGLDPSAAYPGDDQVDVIGVVTFNSSGSQCSWINSSAARAGSSSSTTDSDIEEYVHGLFQQRITWDADGCRGVERWRSFALQHQKPLAISLWGTDTLESDNADFALEMWNWIRTNGGAGPGRVKYAIYSNLEEFSIFKDGKETAPMTAAAFAALYRNPAP